jgi:hypothetical protein
MKTVLKAFWHGKRIIVKADKYHRIDGFNRTFRINIQVEDTDLLPECFINGTSHKANIDVIETVGGLPNYIAKILNEAAEREYMRKTKPIEEQLSLF